MMSTANNPNGSQYKALLARQLDLTARTWAQLRNHGVDEETELQLDFFFEAPSRVEVEGLARHLEAETDYQCRVVADEDRWMLRGRTQPVRVSGAILKQWVDWMVSAGAAHQCTFDGWGAEVPDREQGA